MGCDAVLELLASLWWRVRLLDRRWCIRAVQARNPAHPDLPWLLQHRADLERKLRRAPW